MIRFVITWKITQISRKCLEFFKIKTQSVRGVNTLQIKMLLTSYQTNYKTIQPIQSVNIRRFVHSNQFSQTDVSSERKIHIKNRTKGERKRKYEWMVRIFIHSFRTFHFTETAILLQARVKEMTWWNIFFPLLKNN